MGAVAGESLRCGDSLRPRRVRVRLEEEMRMCPMRAGGTLLVNW